MPTDRHLMWQPGDGPPREVAPLTRGSTITADLAARPAWSMLWRALIRRQKFHARMSVTVLDFAVDFAGDQWVYVAVEVASEETPR